MVRIILPYSTWMIFFSTSEPLTPGAVFSSINVFKTPLEPSSIQAVFSGGGLIDLAPILYKDMLASGSILLRNKDMFCLIFFLNPLVQN